MAEAGGNMDENTLRMVLEKGKVVEGFDPTMFRKDACDAWIAWDKFGAQDNLYGWEVDHICPKAILVSRGFKEEVIDDLRNLRPLQHENNASKGDDYPSYTAMVMSEGRKNIRKENNLTVNAITRRIIDELYPR